MKPAMPVTPQLEEQQLIQNPEENKITKPKNKNKKKSSKKNKKDKLEQQKQDLLLGKIDKTKFKTEMCKNWIEQGYCRYGTKCQFAHGNVEVIIKKDPVHDKYKSKQCKQFHEKAFCPYGKRCQFRHEERCFGEVKNLYYAY